MVMLKAKRQRRQRARDDYDRVQQGVLDKMHTILETYTPAVVYERTLEGYSVNPSLPSLDPDEHTLYFPDWDDTAMLRYYLEGVRTELDKVRPVWQSHRAPHKWQALQFHFFARDDQIMRWTKDVHRGTDMLYLHAFYHGQNEINHTASSRLFHIREIWRGDQ